MGDISGGEVALYTIYDPESMAVIRAYKNCFLQPMCVFKDQEEEDCVIVYLTIKDNTIL